MDIPYSGWRLTGPPYVPVPHNVRAVSRANFSTVEQLLPVFGWECTVSQLATAQVTGWPGWATGVSEDPLVFGNDREESIELPVRVDVEGVELQTLAPTDSAWLEVLVEFANSSGDVIKEATYRREVVDGEDLSAGSTTLLDETFVLEPGHTYELRVALLAGASSEGALRCRDQEGEEHEATVDGPIGTEGPDVIVGTDEGEVIEGKGGNDLICGRGGGDEISGGAGHDEIHGESGGDAIQGGAGSDWLAGGEGSDDVKGEADGDSVFGGPGNDSELRGGPGHDEVGGGTGDDSLYGGDGDDELDGGNGNDVLYGENGSDWALGGGGQGQRDEVYGGPGLDDDLGVADLDTLDLIDAGPDGALFCSIDVIGTEADETRNCSGLAPEPGPIDPQE